MMDIRYITPEDIKHSLVNLNQLVFEVTDDCNLNCVYCAYGELYCDYDKREKAYMRLSDVKQLIDYFAELWRNNLPEASIPETVIGFYGGEPLLNMPFIKDVINYLDSLSCKRRFKYSMTTNAVLLNRYMDYLVNKDFSVLISLDGDEFANSYRVNAAGYNPHKDILRNVKMLIEKYPEYYKRQINFNAVLHDKNDVESIMKFFKELAKTPELSELSTTGINPSKIALFKRMYNNLSQSFRKSDSYEQLVEDAFIECPEIYSVLRYVEVESNNIYNSYEQLLSTTSKGFVPTGTCLPFSKKMFVTVNGKILPCERVSHAYYLGKVTEKELSLDLQKVADKHNGYLKRILTCCQTCACVSRCLKCVYQIDNLETHTISCEQHMTPKDFEGHQKKCYKYLESRNGLYRRLLDVIG